MDSADVEEEEWFLTDPDPKLAADGWRLRVARETGCTNVLVERERVLPEQLNNPSPNVVLEARSFGWMSVEEVSWLHGVLGEFLGRPQIAAWMAVSASGRGCIAFAREAVEQQVADRGYPDGDRETVVYTPLAALPNQPTPVPEVG